MIHKRSKVEFHPLGVIGAIVSWNYPFHNIFNPMLAAVFLGNNIVIKVSKNASWSGCFYIRIIQAALVAIGAPENLVDVVTGFVETGEAMVASVDKVIFVGSPGVGRMIMRNVAETLASVTLELGGKDPFIMCDDVDVPHVAQIVHSAVYSSFIKQVEKIVKSVSAVSMLPLLHFILENVIVACGYSIVSVFYHYGCLGFLQRQKPQGAEVGGLSAQ